MAIDKDAFVAKVMAAVNEYVGAVAVQTEVPDGFVAIRPTGPEGAGKVRIWPKPLRTEGQAPQDGEMYWGYLGRIQGIINPWTGKPCWDAGRNTTQVPGFNPYTTVDGCAELADRATNWRDWATAEDVAQMDKNIARDVADNNRFSGGLLG